VDAFGVFDSTAKGYSFGIVWSDVIMEISVGFLASISSAVLTFTLREFILRSSSFLSPNTCPNRTLFIPPQNTMTVFPRGADDQIAGRLIEMAH